MNWNKIITHPENFFFRTDTRRFVYKCAAQLACARKLSLRKKLSRQLPTIPPQYHISKKEGLHLFDSENEFVPEKSAALTAADAIIDSIETQRGMTPSSREFMENFIGPWQLEQYPALLRLGLAEPVLAMVTKYLGELPTLPYIFLWRSQPTPGPLKTSQFYHLDHSDVRQIKLFIFLSNIDEQNGPLSVIPASSSLKLKKKLRYNWFPENRRVYDEDMHCHPESSSLKSLVGKKGTAVFADTSRLFHYGSRMKKGIRYILVYRYLTTSNFLFNPFVEKSYPLAHMVSPDHSPIQRAVLTGLP